MGAEKPSPDLLPLNVSSVKIPRSTHAAIERRSKAEGQSRGYLIRQAVELFFEGDLLPRSPRTLRLLDELAEHLGTSHFEAMDVALAAYLRNKAGDDPEPRSG